VGDRIGRLAGIPDHALKPNHNADQSRKSRQRPGSHQGGGEENPWQLRRAYRVESGPGCSIQAVEANSTS